ncbi:MAG: toxin-antitoxin system HicB family antitoxin [Anaerolineae bacterium]|nr:toxin-antitoxin system HicB family antitoxin [Anaerolineae bacterium]
MGRLTLRLPDTLHQQLISLAQEEGISLNQLIVYALTRQVTLAYTVRPLPETAVQQQTSAYTALLQNLGQASFEEVRAVLDEREMAYSERTLNTEVVQLLRERIMEAGMLGADETT